MIYDDNDTEFSDLITECPLCHCVIDPRVVNIYNADEINKSNYIIGVETRIVTFYCKKCKSFFHANFTRVSKSYEWFTNDIYPKKTNDTKYSQIISFLSPNFINCFNQAEQAETEGLNELAGIGYRKSIEYLIKDFASKLNPDKETEIKSDNKLSNVIANRIPDKAEFCDIKEMAKSSWALGCDFVHYDKKYIDYDIGDLKQCIDLTVTAIEFFFKRAVYSKNNLK